MSGGTGSSGTGSAGAPSGACRQVRLELGAYALDGLGPAARARIDEHLLSCPLCAVELSELEEATALLARLDAVDVAGLGPQLDLASRVATVVDLDRRRRRRARRALGAVAAALVLLGGAVVLVGTQAGGDGEVYSTGADASGHVAMRVAVHDQPGGSALTVAVRGVASGEHCRLVAIATDGRREDAGTWAATYAGRASVVETTTFPEARLARLELYGTSGRLLASVATA